MSFLQKYPRLIRHTSLFQRRSQAVVLLSKYSKQTSDDDLDKPIDFLNSKAFEHRAQTTRQGAPIKDYAVPWYHDYVVSASLAVFMLYFFILREENDIDQEFEKSLYDRVDGLEEVQLQMMLDQSKSKDLDTAEIEKRLAEIRSGK